MYSSKFLIKLELVKNTQILDYIKMCQVRA
jgi:hypothetical protein